VAAFFTPIYIVESAVIIQRKVHVVKLSFCNNWIWESMLNPADKRFQEWVRYKRIRSCESELKEDRFFLCENECIAHELCVWWKTHCLSVVHYSIVKVPLEKNSLRPAARRGIIGRSVGEISIHVHDINHNREIM
jgi:hypothetical protein